MRKVASVVVLVLVACIIAALAQSPVSYQVESTWAHLPAGLEWGRVSAVAFDGQDSIFTLSRTDPAPVKVFATDGRFITSWGDGHGFSGAHGIYVDPEGFVWIADNVDNVVYKFTSDGELLFTLGKKGVAGDNTSVDLFDGPSDVAVAANGDVFIADGYRNSRIMKFSSDGRFIKIIGGTKGTAPGEFDLLHAIVIDDLGRLIAADSGNARIQVLDQDGRFIEQWVTPSRGGLAVGSHGTIYVSDANAGTITGFRDGRIVDLFGNLGRPHQIDIDLRGHLYTGEPANNVTKKIVVRR